MPHAKIAGIEYVRCNLCDADDYELVYQVPVRPDQMGEYALDTWDIVRCKSCGLIYVNPRFDAPAMENFYRFRNPMDRAFVEDWFIQNSYLRQETWKRFLRVIRRFCPSGRLLDVGCGSGSFLAAAKETGFQSVGQEVSTYFVEYCRNQLGLTVLDGELETCDFELASFDCVTCFDVIEHHPDPKRLLRSIRRLLKTDGLVVIGTHDIGNYFARLYGVRWRHIAPVGHLTYFTRATLTRMLSESGFRLVYGGGMHTADASRIAEFRNYISQGVRNLFLRALILGFYKPLSTHAPSLTHWQIHLKSGALDHEKLLRRAGTQIIMNDNMVLFAKLA